MCFMLLIGWFLLTTINLHNVAPIMCQLSLEKVSLFLGGKGGFWGAVWCQLLNSDTTSHYHPSVEQRAKGHVPSKAIFPKAVLSTLNPWGLIQVTITPMLSKRACTESYLLCQLNLEVPQVTSQHHPSVEQKDDQNIVPNRGLEPLFPAWEASVITTYTNSDAPAGNRTRGPTMATLDFTTKPLALGDFSKKCLIHKTNKNTHGKIASLLEPALKVQHPNYKSIREVLKWLIMFWNWYHRYLHHHHLLIMSIHSR